MITKIRDIYIYIYIPVALGRLRVGILRAPASIIYISRKILRLRFR